ncbi:MAG: hypothetical protein AB1896_00620 [Thermodesulfobacteriota bacterium]
MKQDMSGPLNIQVERRGPAGPEDAPPPDYSLDRAVGDIGAYDHAVFLDLIDTNLSPEQSGRVAGPWQVLPRQKEVLAVHWHPEWIPLELIARRVSGTFPESRKNLVIPTQHNELMVWGDYAGVEMDCYSSGFNRKVQLLLHFKASRLAGAGALRSMLAQTLKYRSSQLFEFMDSIVLPQCEDRMAQAVAETGASEEVAALARFYTARLRKMFRDHETEIPPIMIKNKLVLEFIQSQRRRHPQALINRALLLVRSVKEIVKRNFSLEHFFRASEVIEEARAWGGGVVIPHPEQFWPILLADYDVDGWEVWNPESQEYTKFLIGALNTQNRIPRSGRKKLLVFMGDDTHMSVKIRDPGSQEPGRLEREVGLQPAWEDMGIREKLRSVGASRLQTIEEYLERLG